MQTATLLAMEPPSVADAVRPRQLPGAAAGYPVSLTEAARRLEMTPDHLVDMVRAGCVTALVVAAYETVERPPLRFDPVALDTFAAALHSPPIDAPTELRVVSEVHAVAAALRAYLAEAAPTDTEPVAVGEGRPLLGLARDKVIYAHVRQAEIATRAPQFASRLARIRLASPNTLIDALNRLGCREVRGVRPADGGRQSWKSWWRVPLSIWSLQDEDTMRVDDFPALGGIPRHGDETDTASSSRGDDEP